MNPYHYLKRHSREQLQETMQQALYVSTLSAAHGTRRDLIAEFGRTRVVVPPDFHDAMYGERLAVRG